MSERENLHHADVGGADETITVGAYRFTGVPTITLWAGFAASECGCNIEREPAEVKLPHYPRLLANLLTALGEASRAGGAVVDLDLMSDAELDTYLDDTAAAMGAATDEVMRLGVLHSAAAVAKSRRVIAACSDRDEAVRQLDRFIAALGQAREELADA